MRDVIWCGNNYYTLWVDAERTEQCDFKYVLHYEKWYNGGGPAHTWPVVPLWENTIEEISYVREVIIFNGESFEQSSSYPTLKQEVIEWCNEVIGPRNKEWGIPRPNLVSHTSSSGRSDWVEFIGATTSYGVYFRLKRHAMLFKLTWS